MIFSMSMPGFVATKDIHTCAKIIGHSITYMTERYAGLVQEKAKQGMNQYSEFLPISGPPKLLPERPEN